VINVLNPGHDVRRLGEADRGMGTDILRFIRTSPIFPFAGFTLLTVFTLWISWRRLLRRTTVTGELLVLLSWILPTIALWVFGFYKLFVEP